MIHILVTGANGQLGKSIQNIANNYPNLTFYFTDIDNLDVTSTEALEFFFDNNQVNYIINCAAYTAVDKAENDKQAALLLNTMAPLNLLKQAEQHHAKLIHISTDYVFSGNNFKPYKETDTPDPISIYGQTKLQGEINIRHSPEVIIIRTSWLYSPTGNNFVKTILKLTDTQEKLTIVADQTGTPTYAKDLAEVILNIILFSDTNNVFINGIYHYSNEGICSWYDFAKSILEIKNISKTIVPIRTSDLQYTAPRPFFSVLEKTKIKNTFNLTIPYWRDSLKDCLHVL